MAIQITQRTGAKDFATVGLDSRRQPRQLPQQKYDVPEAQIFNSRDNTFIEDVLNVTDRKGVDVVLLAGFWRQVRGAD